MPAPERYAFGDFTHDARDRSLHRGQDSIHLEPKAHDVLIALVRQAGRLVTKRELMDQVWPDAYVEERILTVHVSTLRKALGDANKPSAYIASSAATSTARVAWVRLSSSSRITRAIVSDMLASLAGIDLTGGGESRSLSFC